MTADTPIARWLQATKDYAVIVTDDKGIVREWLGGATEILGYEAGEAVGQPISLIFTAQDRQSGMDAYELNAAALAGKSEDERWHVRKDGTRIWASGTVTAIRDEKGGITNFVKTMRDRTDARAQVDRLEQQVAMLEGKRAQVRNFLRTLGHELRNPLAPLSNAKFIIERLATDDRATGAARVIGAQLAVLERLANDLMDVARLELGKMELDLQRVDVRELLERTADALLPEATRRGLQLETMLPDRALLADVDTARFEQVVLNLLGNALKYTRSGGSIWLRATQEGNEVVLRVQDTGIGIAPEVLPRIFELFTQDLDASLVAPGGLGVGLALVRQVVELHGGTVQARSAGVGKGAEFVVRLPSAPPPQ